jgi:hypothetical protein
VGAELILGIKSKFDAKGSEAAAAGLEGIVRGADKAGEGAKRLAKDFVDLELRQRKVETATRIVGSELITMAGSGFSVASAAQAGAGAVSFLGNALKFASGPIGIAVTVLTSLASAALMLKANSEQATTAIVDPNERTIATDKLNRARAILSVEKELADSKKTEKDLLTLIRPLQEENTRNTALRTRAKLDLALAEHNVAAGAMEFVRIAKEEKEEIADLTTKISANTERINTLKDAAYGAGQAADLLAASLRNVGSASAGGTLGIGLVSLETVKAGLTIESSMGRVGNSLDLTKVKWQEVGTAAKDAGFLEAMAARIAADEVAAAESKKRAAVIQTAQATANVAGALASYLEQTGNASFETIQGIRIAEAVINTAAATMAAWNAGLNSTGNYYAAAAMAASVAAVGALQIAAIASASPGGGSAPPAAPSFSGSPATAPATGPPVGTPVGTPVGPTGTSTGFSGTMNLNVNVTLNALDADSVSKASLRRLADRIADMIWFRIHGLGGKVAFG